MFLGLDNFNLEDQQLFDDALIRLINDFLSRQNQPICLVAHNGTNFDFPLLKSEISKTNTKLMQGLFCADSLEAFRAVFSGEIDMTSAQTPVATSASTSEHVKRRLFQSSGKVAQGDNTSDMAKMLEPRCSISAQSVKCTPPGLKGTSAKKPQSFALAHVYKLIFGSELVDAHSAEADCLALVQIFNSKFDLIVPWIDNHAALFD